MAQIKPLPEPYMPTNKEELKTVEKVLQYYEATRANPKS